MADQATQRIVIAASPERCRAIAADFAAYPEWAENVKAATVLSLDDEGRGNEVEYRAAAMGRSTTYTLRYNYGSNPLRISWRLMRGDLMHRLDGEYEFAPVEGNPDACEVTYHLSVELSVPLPGFVKRRAESKIMHAALDELKQRTEASVVS